MLGTVEATLHIYDIHVHHCGVEAQNHLHSYAMAVYPCRKSGTPAFQ